MPHWRRLIWETTIGPGLHSCLGRHAIIAIYQEQVFTTNDRREYTRLWRKHAKIVWQTEIADGKKRYKQHVRADRDPRKIRDPELLAARNTANAAVTQCLRAANETAWKILYVARDGRTTRTQTGPTLGETFRTCCAARDTGSPEATILNSMNSWGISQPNPGFA